MKTAQINIEGLEYSIRIHEDGHLIDNIYVNEIEIALVDPREIGEGY